MEGRTNGSHWWIGWIFHDINPTTISCCVSGLVSTATMDVMLTAEERRTELARAYERKMRIASPPSRRLQLDVSLSPVLECDCFTEEVFLVVEWEHLEMHLLKRRWPSSATLTPTKIRTPFIAPCRYNYLRGTCSSLHP